VGVQSSYLADIFQPSLGRVRYEHAHPFTTGTVKVVQDDARLTIKRVIDVVGAALGLALLAPLLLLIAGAIRLAGPGPVFFVQPRYGLNKRLFRMYKFRTMVSNAEVLQQTLEEKNEAQGPLFKIAEDPRVTRLGHLLRRTSLDELPQLWNVLNGEMSLVGPRPLPMRDVGRFDEGRFMRRFSVRPGLTGLWQVMGRSDVCFERCIAMDLEYIDTWSLWLDVKVLLLTVPAVLASRGAH
jgi:exopolysaccharide biosynthesis polyprenyl glycosylphosphotransferase